MFRAIAARALDGAILLEAYRAFMPCGDSSRETKLRNMLFAAIYKHRHVLMCCRFVARVMVPLKRVTGRTWSEEKKAG
jgi:hypothetical protein